MMWFSDQRMATFDCAFDIGLRKWFEIAGTGGSLVCDDFLAPNDVDCPRFWTHNGQGESSTHECEGVIQQTAMVQRFCEIIQSGELDERWFEESLATQRVVDALLESLKSGQEDKRFVRHVIRRSGKNPVVLPLNRMPSDRKPKLINGESFDWGPLDVLNAEMGDTKITTWAMRQLRAGFDKPFFMAVGYYRPHIPLWAPQKYFQRFDNVEIKLPIVHKNDLADLGAVGKKWATEAVTAGSHATVVKYGQWEEAVKAYLACTTYVDDQVGRLLSELDNGKYRDNTVIVLWTDHGWHLGEKQHWGKWTPWQRSTRVPLIVVPPRNRAGQFGSNVTCDTPVSLLDLYPTLMEMCGIPGAPGWWQSGQRTRAKPSSRSPHLRKAVTLPTTAPRRCPPQVARSRTWLESARHRPGGRSQNVHPSSATGQKHAHARGRYRGNGLGQARAMTRQHILDAAAQVPPFGPAAHQAAGGASCIST